MLAEQDEKGGRGADVPHSEGERKRKRETGEVDDTVQNEAQTELRAQTTQQAPQQAPQQANLPATAAPTKKYDLAKMTNQADLSKVVEGQEPVTKSLIPAHIEHGVLIPLKTTLELRDDHQCGQVLITRSPVRSTSAVISLLRDMLPEEIVKGMPHLRRCAKPIDLPAHLKTQFMNDTPASKQIHTGKSNWVYVLLGLEATLVREEITAALAKLDGFEDGVFLASIPVPLLAPTSQIQAALWTSQFWPTMYRKNNPLGPHPSMVVRATDEIAADAPLWMALAHDMAAKAQAAGYGEAMGACIVYRGEDGARLVAVAGDARWRHHHRPAKTGAGSSGRTGRAGNTGNPMAHAVLRAISMVAQKLVRAEKKNQRKRSSAAGSQSGRPAGLGPDAGDAAASSVPVTTPVPAGKENNPNLPAHDDDDDDATAAQPPTTDAPDQAASQVHNAVQDRVRDRLSRNRDRGHAGHRQRLAFEAFQDKPLLEEEERIFGEEHPTPDGYLCHGLELYVTHEPCAMCSMAILHSRMGKVVFANRMPLTGGLSAEDRVLAPTDLGAGEGGPVPKRTRTGEAIPNGEGIHGLGLFWRRELNWSLLAWEWEAHCCCKPLAMEPTTHA